MSVNSKDNKILSLKDIMEAKVNELKLKLKEKAQRKDPMSINDDFLFKVQKAS